MSIDMDRMAGKKEKYGQDNRIAELGKSPLFCRF